MLSPNRQELVDVIVDSIRSSAAEATESMRARVTAVVGEATSEELREMGERVAATGGEWGYHPPNALARKLNHAMAGALIAPGSSLDGVDVLDAARRGPVTFLANHLSFADANLFEAMLHEAGCDDIAGALTVVTGPKVYSDVSRRFSSLSFGTIKTPQSVSRASGEAVMTRREVARLAKTTLAAVAERRAAGDHTIVFVEGTRSRTATMQRTLDAVSRYVDDESSTIIALGVTGSERMVPIGDERLHRAEVHLHLGRAVSARTIKEKTRRNRRLVMDVVGHLIAAQLPSEYRGVYGSDGDELAEARDIARLL